MATKGSQFKIRNSWGVYDVYKHIRKNHWYNIGRKVTEKEFYSIIRGVNLLLAENIANGETLGLPERMGKLELRKHNRGVSFVDGKLKNTYPIDWKSTNLLWRQDEEEHKKRTLLRFEEPIVYHVRYCKGGATYNNKVFYQFRLNQSIKQTLKKNIMIGKTDTLW